MEKLIAIIVFLVTIIVGLSIFYILEIRETKQDYLRCVGQMNTLIQNDIEYRNSIDK